MAYLAYLVSSILFVFSLKGLSRAKTAFKGNLFGITGMIIAIITTFFSLDSSSLSLVILVMIFGGGIGFLISKKTQMTALPQLVAAFHSLIGLAAVFIAFKACVNPLFKKGTSQLIEMSLGAMIGAITFTGSIIAFLKLQSILKKTFVHKRHLNLILLFCLLVLTVIFSSGSGDFNILLILSVVAGILGIFVFVPVGGADMPVIVSLLNSYSGFAAVGIGFTLNNHLLIITGSIVGSSGAILSYVMCKAMNRSIFQVIFGGSDYSFEAQTQTKPVKISTPVDCGFMLGQASNVIIVPGYGMAVSHASYIVREITQKLNKKSIGVKFAIHPVAGRMPGHMNVLLAEANIPYDDIFELDDINYDFSRTDVVLVIGANDITNPRAKTDKSSPIYGMPILNVDQSKVVFFIKRSLGAGYAGIDNDLFYKDNTFMVLGDAKNVCEEILRNIE